MSRAWKEAEKETAKLLGGVRRIRVDYSESVCDVVHPVYSIEVKYGNQIPKCLRVKEPTLFGEFLLIPSVCFPIREWVAEKKGSCKFLQDAMEQAIRYDHTKIPLVSLKPPRYIGVILVLGVV